MDKIKMILAMLIFGTLGTFVHFIHLPSPILAAFRAIIATVFLGIYMIISPNKPNSSNIRKELHLLIPSGIVLGFMWIFLFRAYTLSTVAIATLCHYMAPIFVMLLSPLFFKEKLNIIKIICILAAISGIFLVSGITGGSSPHLNGILFGLLSATFYTAVIIMNKFTHSLPPAETTFFQLFVAAIVLSVYSFLTENFVFSSMSTMTIVLVLIVGVVHTGITYFLFFNAVEDMPAQSVAILSYIDPVAAILLSTFFLGQTMGALQWIGAALILGSTLLYEIFSDGIRRNPHDHLR